MAERQGIEIDYCPSCRGVWLDRGELDKIIERSNAHPAEPVSPVEPSYRHPPQEPYPTHGGHGGHYGHGYGHSPQYKKKKSLLSEIFDFD
jgi:Zn-finger nucleic acid-binding protein